MPRSPAVQFSRLGAVATADILPTKFPAGADTGHNEIEFEWPVDAYTTAFGGRGHHRPSRPWTDFKSVGPGPAVGAVGSTPSRSRHANTGVAEPPGHHQSRRLSFLQTYRSIAAIRGDYPSDSEASMAFVKS